MNESLVARKLQHMFTLFDSDANGVVEAADFERIAAWIAGRLNAQFGTPLQKKVLAAYMSLWNQLAGMDANSDGRVTPAEWVAGWQQMARAEVFDAVVGKAAQDLFDCVDTDGSGVIGADEFSNWLCAHGVSGADAKTAFSKQDLNGDGSISRDEELANVREFFTSDDPAARGN